MLSINVGIRSNICPGKDEVDLSIIYNKNPRSSRSILILKALYEVEVEIRSEVERRKCGSETLTEKEIRPFTSSPARSLF